jgi:hypothetical protein|tara:strand:+ start:652 stop:894 length:243 start_codon:yes stop_codon:yes gene_type:complete
MNWKSASEYWRKIMPDLTVSLTNDSWQRVQDAFLAAELLGDDQPVTEARVQQWLKDQLVVRVNRYETETERKKIQISSLN